MAKVKYKNKECDVISVQTEWGHRCYKGGRVTKPCNTWLLISIDGSIEWVPKSECIGIE